MVDDLDPGEKQAILLAAGYADDVLLVMDDRAGRRVARPLEIPTTGLVGMLVRLKEVEAVGGAAGKRVLAV